MTASMKGGGDIVGADAATKVDDLEGGYAFAGGLGGDVAGGGGDDFV